MAASSTTAIAVEMVEDRVTPGKIRFAEVDQPQPGVDVLGQVYVPKATTAALGYTEGSGKRLRVTLEVLS